MPMTTMCVTVSSMGNKLRKWKTCSRSSSVLRFRTTPLSPLAQKIQPMPQPTCVLETYRPSRSSKHQYALDSPAIMARQVLTYPRRLPPRRDRRRVYRRQPIQSSNARRSDLGRSDISSKPTARLRITQSSNCLHSICRISPLDHPAAPFLKRSRKHGTFVRQRRKNLLMPY